MKSYRWVNDSVKCPYYKEQDQQKIYCSGTEVGVVFHVAFATPSMLKEFQKQYCKCKGCPFAKGLDDYWE